MKRSTIALLLLTLLSSMWILSACTKLSKEWWLEMKYVDETRLTDYRLNMPITIEENNTLSGLGMLEVRQLIEGETTGFPECLAGETNGVRVRGEITLIGSYRDGKILVESLEPTAGPGSFSLVYYCVKDDVERDIKNYTLESNSTVSQVFSDAVIDALLIFSEGMLKFPMDPVNGFSGQDDQGFSFILHKGKLPKSK
jgi:hypothetical protein